MTGPLTLLRRRLCPRSATITVTVGENGGEAVFTPGEPVTFESAVERWRITEANGMEVERVPVRVEVR